MELAKRQQLQLNAHQAELEERRRQQEQLLQAKRQGLNVADEADRLRQQIRADETQLQRLAQQKREVQQLRGQQQDERVHLRQLEDQYQGTEQYMRQAAATVQSLRQQMEQIQARRAAVAHAAIAQQRKVNVQQGLSNAANNPSGTSTPAPAAEVIYGQIQKPAMRPKASVGPFHMQQAQLTAYGGIEKPPPPAYDQVDAIK